MHRFQKGDLAVFIQEPCEFEIVRVTEVKTYADGGISYECEGYDSSFSDSNLSRPGELIKTIHRLSERITALECLLRDAERLGVKMDFGAKQHIFSVNDFRATKTKAEAE